ncbi:MAG: ribonuclease HI [Bacteriovoracaceae bacterium]|jgi:ribonuclease HI|nr:ribonuclease HI [Bacteriovoracaceae bacterium]
MSIKKKLNTSLNKLAQVFEEDPKACEAVDYLVKALKDWDEPKVDKKSIELSLPTEIKDSDDYALFSDGACRGNPGPGSWAAIGQDQGAGVLFESSGVEFQTTNNRMELIGAIEALKSLERFLDECGKVADQAKVHLYTDSKLIVDAMGSWMAGWKRNGWKKSGGKPIINVELWRELDELSEHFKKSQFHWVKGHAGHPQNERCDGLANEALDEAGY